MTAMPVAGGFGLGTTGLVVGILSLVTAAVMVPLAFWARWTGRDAYYRQLRRTVPVAVAFGALNLYRYATHQ
jgi:multidrug efflux pump subunit AcrB